MKKLLCLLTLALSLTGQLWANDGVYFLTGNFLVPTQETDISVTKELLTITIGKDSIATVDVQYELMNNGSAKTVTMAFEAEAPYNIGARMHRDGKHPNIKSFTVTMNGQPLAYSNAIVALDFLNGNVQSDNKPLDMTKWKGYEEAPDSLVPCDNMLYNAELDSTTSFAYGYFFEAPFQEGLNRVHHTYSFLMSYNVMEKFQIPYWLTPVTRWANHQVDDFTLRIKAEEPVKDFCMADSVFAGAPFDIVAGNGELHQMKVASGEHYVYASLGPGAVLEWHTTNFRPTSNMSIEDANMILKPYGNMVDVVIDKEGNEYRFIGDCGNTYFVSTQDYAEIPKEGCKVVEYTPFDGKGWVFPSHVGTFNVRKGPSKKSPVIATISMKEGELPDVCRCLGQEQKQENGNWYWWFRIQVGNKTGYVRTDNMEWDAINTF